MYVCVENRDYTNLQFVIRILQSAVIEIIHARKKKGALPTTNFKISRWYSIIDSKEYFYIYQGYKVQ